MKGYQILVNNKKRVYYTITIPLYLIVVNYNKHPIEKDSPIIPFRVFKNYIKDAREGKSASTTSTKSEYVEDISIAKGYYLYIGEQAIKVKTSVYRLL
jgi:hypothetical protein